MKNFTSILLMAVLTLLPACGKALVGLTDTATDAGRTDAGSTDAGEQSAPTVISTDPAPSTTGIILNKTLSATFSETMNAASITSTTFTLKQNGLAIDGTVAASGAVATFHPTVPLLPDTVYTAALSTGVADTAGHRLAAAFEWSFTTGSALDTTPPTVILSDPGAGAMGVVQNKTITITFSEDIDAATVTAASFTVTQGGISTAGVAHGNGRFATFVPTAALPMGTTFSVIVTTAIKDTAGNAMAANFAFQFSTGTALDTVAPTVVSVDPAAAALHVFLNKTLGVTFSEVMAPTSLNALTFTLKQGTMPVPGTVASLGENATFRPLTDLSVNTVYTATISTSAKDTAGNALAAPFTWSFTTGTQVATTVPTIVSVDPLNGSLNVLLNRTVGATFSEAMNATTLNGMTFKVKEGTTVLAGTFTHTSTNVTFHPAMPLAPNSTFMATITTGATNTAGAGLAHDTTWTFTTGSGLPTLTPTVIATDPLDGSVGIPVNKLVSVTFSAPMNTATLNTASFTLKQGLIAVPGAVGNLGANSTFAPTTALLPNTEYTASISTAATTSTGHALAAAYSWAFTTGLLPDITPPTIVSTSPDIGALDISITRKVWVTFSEPMAPNTVNTLSFTVKQGSTLVPGTVTYIAGATSGLFVPDHELTVNTVYTATVSTEVTDSAGVALDMPYTWIFTTSACSQGRVELGAAGTFAVLAGSTVTNTGNSSLLGDLGTSPGTAVTGFPPGAIAGDIHAGDTAAAAAIGDLGTAYTAAAGRTLCPVTISGNLGGQTLTPGLYMSTSSLAISSGELTLDAQGDPDAVFVFQTASTLTTTAGRRVILTGGARAANVFWQIGTSATLGTMSAFAGTIMADQSITMNTGASLNGRALAHGGAVALDTNTIVRPNP